MYDIFLNQNKSQTMQNNDINVLNINLIFDLMYIKDEIHVKMLVLLVCGIKSVSHIHIKKYNVF